MPAVTVPVAMRWSDMDAYGHVNNTEFFRYTEQARIEALALVKARPDTGTLVVRHEVEYLVPLEYRSDGVQVDVWITRIGGAGFDLGYEVATLGPASGDDEAADGRGGDTEDAGERRRTVHARSASTMVMYSFSAAAPRRISPEEREFLEGMTGPEVRFRRSGR
ncbi:acyl-CoA thioesterase [Jannaschia sp. R86511]|uniref:acyl-CoA thioesterase n=1 Tax=Jannaschia sp. R86511 TaxID=3093853 RepID=UPI0036D20D3B